MKEEFVPYDIALAMKELGFDKKCMMHWFKGKLSYYKMGDFAPSHTPAPLYQQAFRWFREKHSIWVTFEYDDCDCVEADICWYVGKCFRYGIGPLFLTNELGDFKTYQEAQEACLRKLIEIVEENM